MVESRHQLMGELAHVSVPDIKEAEGGLRDAGVLKALVATWLVDVPHVDLERSRLSLLDARDVLHEVSGRAGDRIGPDVWAELAPGLGLADAAAAQRHLRVLGRRIAHLSRLTWRRTDDVLLRPSSPAAVRRPRLEPLGPGVALSAGEVVLDADADPTDPLLLLRAAALAAERDVELSPTSTARLVREGSGLPDPWPEGARQLFVRLLAAGRGLRAGLGDPRGDGRAGPDPARVGADPVAAARVGDPPVHRRPAPRRDLHRGVRADPPRRAGPTC